MTIGIAIPTYSGHLYNLENLLTQISKSTVLPLEVSVSISSFDGDLNLGEYPFKLIITKNSEFRNVSQNCNTAASKLNTDVISFFGGDDLPHIKRNEYILKSFKYGSDAVVHNYINAKKNITEFIDDIGELEFYLNYIDKVSEKPLYPISSVGGEVCYANGPISVSKEIFNKFNYNESQSLFKKEDAIYNRNLIENGYKISYIKNNLMLYIH